ncbi:hypothetical protein CDD82_3338 [Ophiocordyceps australis]|uniref:RRM domain-containing protein n=1 Tax=Ophiocordyceps australis TaxID=1399860 RepID=A0A2C5ZF90_9HYPO|nr:hypothetical protein CDD82_3338 [Ophiocordyceps australis]
MSAEATALLDAQSDSADYVRLHITPLDAELLSTYLSPTLVQLARNVSFHVPETWPEKRFGFVELPQPEATKLRKKLHGSMFKGARVRIEIARPQNWQKHSKRSESSASCDHDANENPPQSAKRQKREAGVLEGVRLGGRKVVRGWTEPLDTKIRSKRSKDTARECVRGDKKRSRPSSKYTDGPECLMRLKLPSNSASTTSDPGVRSSSKRHNTHSTITIHEFENTTRYPSFLKNDPPLNYGQPAAEYIQGKGWVAQDGSIIEAVRAHTKEKIQRQAPVESTTTTSDGELDDGTTSSSNSTSAPQDQDSDPSISTADQVPRAAGICTHEDKETRSTPSCHDEAHCKASSHAKLDESPRPQSSSLPNTNLSIAIPPLSSPCTTKPVHALEALYKRTKDVSIGQKNQTEPFHFFDLSSGGDEMELSGASCVMPLTPRADRDRRSIRSSAPTPDTAKPSHKRIFWSETDPEEEDDDDEDQDDEAGDEEEEEEDDDDDESKGKASHTDMRRDHDQEAPTQQQVDNGQPADFQSWFWQNRSDLNRSWMKRRKTAAKEERYKNNKARAARRA